MLVIKLVYQKGIGRMIPKVCIYEPSCSNYMIQAISTHGLIKGLLMGSWRILRCHPFAKGGWDPVPGYNYKPTDDNEIEEEETDNNKETIN